MKALPDALFQVPPFGLSRAEKNALLFPLLKDLTEHHKKNCAAYAKIIDVAFKGHEGAYRLEELPYLPVSLFKNRTLHSVDDRDVRVTIKSSGTTGALRSRILMDLATTQLSSKALAATLRGIVGSERLPLLFIDTPSALQGAMDMGARAAALLGMMPFGYDTTFALKDDLSIDQDALLSFLAKHKGKPVLIYGFTYLVWQAFLPACQKLGLDLAHAVLLHSGGWKHLARQSIDNRTFRSSFQSASGLSRIVNFYGMAELPGVIMAENENGLLYPPVFGDILIRDPVTLEPLPEGKTGLVQVFSCVPRSFPGHSLLTEDLGVIRSVDEAHDGWAGKGFQIIGRVPKAELRGCSDVIAETA
jgi:hypothetical protein